MALAPKALRQSEEANAEFVRRIGEHGGQVLLDARTRRSGSHHQKLVVLRHPGAPGRDVAFIGGIDPGCVSAAGSSSCYARW